MANDANTTDALPSPTGSYRDYIEYDIAVGLVRYIYPLIFIFGLTGNILTVCVLLKRSIGKKSTSYLLVSLAVADSCILLFSLLRKWIVTLDDRFSNFDMIVPFFCSMRYFLNYYLTHLSVWFLVLVTTERFISVIFSLKAVNLCKTRNAVISICVVTVTMFLLDAHLLYGIVGIYRTPEKIACRLRRSSTYRYFWFKFWGTIDICISTLIPFFFILFCNVSIIVKVRMSSRKTKSRTTNESSSDSKITNMTAMLLTINFMFLITSLPFTLYMLVWSEIKIENHAIAQDILAQTSVSALNYVNNAVNFLLYCVSGPRFREQFMAMIGYRSSRVNPVIESTDGSTIERSTNTNG
ncbi:neuropeptides capa receptor-like [Tubulanus polymorphus]|uniref:neuropeptides capa receptor-like n=1 Tax=Tubulanus polymorphus TaxID=672921 RepID=UPI003DA57FB7